MTEDIGNLLRALHVLGAVVWVGGMVFALFVLRPALGLLAPAQRISLLGAVFARFFRIVWHAMPIVILSGYGLVFGVYGGFKMVDPAVHVMHGLGIAMAVVFAVLFFGPWAGMRAALADGDTAAAAAAAERIRRLVLANMVLGLITVAVAAFA